MEYSHDHTQTILSPQAGLDRRTAFRIWSLTPQGKTLVELAPLLKLTASGLSRSLNYERMPTEYHRILVDAGVPEHLLPRAEDVPRGPRPNKDRPGD